MSGAGTIRVFLLDDHDGVRAAVRGLLEMEPDLTVVADHASAAGAADLIVASRPDVAVLDCRLGDGSGVEVCREVLDRSPQVRVLLLTSKPAEEALLSAVLGGASGFALKGMRGSSLAQVVRDVASGAPVLEPHARAVVRDRLPQLLADRARTPDVDVAVAEHMAAGLSDGAIAEVTGLDPGEVRRRTTAVLEALDLRDPA